MKRKLPLILLALLACALLFALPLSPEAHADITGTYDNVPWVITGDGTLIIGDGGTCTFADTGSRDVDSYGWYAYRDQVKSVRFSGTVNADGDMKRMFYGYPYLRSADLRNFYGGASLLIANPSLAEMFRDCTALTSVTADGNTFAGVTDLTRMFYGCSALKTLSLPALDPSADLTDMFSGMSSLQMLTLAAYTNLGQTGFGNLGHSWAVSDDGYAYAYTANGIVVNFSYGKNRSIQRVIGVNYDMSGGTPPDWFAVVPFSVASNYNLYAPTFSSVPYQQEFKCWKDPNGDEKKPGESVNLLSYNNDSLLFTAKWRPAVNWTWPSSSQATATTLDGNFSLTDTHPAFISDTSTCTVSGETTYVATVTFDPGVLGPEAETYTCRAEFYTDPHHTLVHHDAVAPKCTVAGNIEYWNCTRGCGQYFTDAGGLHTIQATAVVLSATGHSWAAPTYTWAANNRSVQARHVCTKDASHVETETRATTATVAKQPTCTEMGQTTYTATFANASFQTQTKTLENIPALGHAWSPPAYAWAEDNRSVNAQRVCGRDNSHRENEIVNTTLQTLAPTCTTAGIYRYTAVFTNPAFPTQEKLVTSDPALGHDLLRHAPVEATCVETGVIEYWECLNCGDFFADADAAEEIPDHNSVITPALGHVYLEEWDADETGHWHNCKRCGARTLVYSHVPDHIPTVEAPARCIECGYVISPALVVQSHAYFGMTGDLGIGTVTYTKTKILDDDWIVELPERVPKDEGYYFEGWLSSSDIRMHIPGTQLPFTFTDRKSVIVRGLWTQVIGEGHYDLGADTRYRFDEGSYTISGDSTVYLGEQPFYPATGGSLDVTKAG